jgi:hypothetical protein
MSVIPLNLAIDIIRNISYSCIITCEYCCHYYYYYYYLIWVSLSLFYFFQSCSKVN